METKAAYSQPLYLHLLRLPFTPFPASSRSRSHSIHLARVSATRPHPTISHIYSRYPRWRVPPEKILRTVPGPLHCSVTSTLDLSTSPWSGRGRCGTRRVPEPRSVGTHRARESRGRCNDVIARRSQRRSEYGIREKKKRAGRRFRVEVPAESAAAPADIANPAISFSNLP